MIKVGDLVIFKNQKKNLVRKRGGIVMSVEENAVVLNRDSIKGLKAYPIDKVRLLANEDIPSMVGVFVY